MSKPVYDAEFELRFMLENGGAVEAYGSTLTLPIERKFGDIDGVQRYVDLVWEGDNPPAVRPRRGNTAAHYSRSKHEIAVPDHVGSQHSWAMRELVILHEIAHAMTRGDSHGARFCGVFVDLVSRFIGPEAGFILMAGLSERGVQIKTTMV